MSDHPIVEYLPEMTRYAKLLAGPDWPDLLQDALLRALSKWHLYREVPGGSLRKWLFKIVYNEHIREVRRRNRRKEYQITETEMKIPCHDRTELATYLKEVIQKIDALPDHMREALLTYFSTNSYDEGAAKLGIVHGTFRSRLARARDEMQRICY